MALRIGSLNVCHITKVFFYEGLLCCLNPLGYGGDASRLLECRYGSKVRFSLLISLLLISLSE